MYRSLSLVVILSLGLASTASAAVLIPSISMPQISPYVDVHMGVVDKNMQTPALDALSTLAQTDVGSKVSTSNMNNAWTLGGDVGVQLGKFLGVEGGGFYFQDGTVTALQSIPSVDPVIDKNQQVKYNSWVGYLAMKAKAPLMRMLDIYAKIGAGYEHQGVSVTPDTNSKGVTDGSFHSWVPVFSVGLEDHLTKSVSINLQYTHLADSWQLGSDKPDDSGGADQFAHRNILTMSLGYLFNL